VAAEGRLAQRLYEVSDGNPLLCKEQCQLLVRQDDVRYEDGAWMLPQ